MIESRIDDGVLVLTISNPAQLNKLCAADYDTLYQELLVYLSAPGERNGIVLIGAQTPPDKRPAFSAGADLLELEVALETDATALARVDGGSKPVAALLEALHASGVHSVAAINGISAGGGTELALACSSRAILSEQKKLLALPEVHVGITPGNGGLVRPLRIVEARNCRRIVDWVRSGTYLSSADVLELGLATAEATNEEALLAGSIDRAIEGTRILRKQRPGDRQLCLPLREGPLPGLGNQTPFEELPGAEHLNEELDGILRMTMIQAAQLPLRVAVDFETRNGWLEAAKLGLWRERIPKILKR